MRLLALLPLLACARHIPEPAATELVSPPPTTAAGLRVCWLEFAVGTLPHGLVVAHGALDEDIVSTASGILITHPTGSWLVDGGIARALEPELDELPAVPRAMLRRSAKDFVRASFPADALGAVGSDPTTLSAGIPTHAHYDHLGGLLDLPALPILLPEPEIAAARRAAEGDGNVALPAEARALLPRAQPLRWQDRPFLLWDQSLDLTGDGGVVLVPMPGHTPGSLGVYVHLPDRELFFAGDTIWAREGYEQREPRSWLAGSFDDDGPANDVQIAKLWMLHQMLPNLVIVPAHDRRQWETAFGQPGCLGG